MVDQFLSDNSTDILYQHASDVTWVPYNKLHVGNYERVHYDTMSDVVVLKVLSKKNTYTRAIQGIGSSEPMQNLHSRFCSQTILIFIIIIIIII